MNGQRDLSNNILINETNWLDGVSKQFNSWAGYEPDRSYHLGTVRC